MLDNRFCAYIGVPYSKGRRQRKKKTGTVLEGQDKAQSYSASCVPSVGLVFDPTWTLKYLPFSGPKYEEIIIRSPQKEVFDRVQAVLDPCSWPRRSRPSKRRPHVKRPRPVADEHILPRILTYKSYHPKPKYLLWTVGALGKGL